MRVEQRNPIVSIVMCAFNGARYLPEQLHTIEAQDMQADEIIIADDCSNDDTPEIVNEFARRTDISVSYFRNDFTLGTSRNVERALSASRGDILLLADQDDLWKSNKVSRLVETLNGNPRCLLVFSDGDCVDHSGSLLGFTLWEKCGQHKVKQLLAPHGSQLEILLGGDVVTGATVGIRRKLLELALPIPQLWIHDAWLAAVAASEQGILGIDEKLIQYRIHSGQQIGVARSRFADHAMGRRRKNPQQDVLRFKKLEEVVGSGLSPDIRGKLRAKIRHLELRASLPSNYLLRVARIGGEALSGRYHRFSSGLSSMLLDVIR